MATRSVRPMIECALLAALSAVLMLLAWYVPVLGIVASLASPLPAAVAVIRHGTRWGVMSSVVAMFVLAPFLGITTALALWAINGAMGISFGVAVRRNYGPVRVLVTAAVGSLVAMVVDYVAAYFTLGLTPAKQMEQFIAILKTSFEQSQEILGPNPQITALLENMPTPEQMLGVVPAMFALAAFTTALVNFSIFRRVLPRLGYNLEPLPRFSTWIFPEYVTYGGIVGYLGLLFAGYLNYPIIQTFAQNLWTVASYLAIVETFCVLAFYMLRSGVSPAMTTVFLIIGVAMIMGSSLLLFVAFFGMIDILFDFRRIRLGTGPEIS